MKGLRTVGVLLGVAFALRFWLHPTTMIHFTYWVVPLKVVGFWFVLLLALILLLRLLIGKPTFWRAHIQRKP
jgi:nitric oxide reductase large subunit